MTQAITPHPTVAARLAGDHQIRSSIDAIVREVRARSAELTDVRPGRSELAEGYRAAMAALGEARGRALFYPYIGSGLGNGALVELADGSVKWDMICGIGVNFFGHSEPDLMAAALEGATSDTLMQGNLMPNEDQHQFSEAVLAEARRGSRLSHVFLSTSGAMANEAALKVCYQKAAPAPRVIAFADCFMGRSIVMSQIGDLAANRVGIPLSTLIDYLPFYDPVEAEEMGRTAYIDRAVRELQRLIDRYPRQHACFIFELVQGEGGFNVGDREYFRALMEVCKANRIPVWDDEIQTFGRTESMFAYDHFKLGDYVDVLCVGKMTQVCATLYTSEFNPQPGLLSGTFTGSAGAFRVGRRVVERLAEGAYYGPEGAIARHHRVFREHVHALAARHPAWFPAVPAIPDIAGGLGGMMRMTPFGGRKDAVVKACHAMFQEGVIVFYAGHGPYHVRMLPPLGVMQESDWPRVFACIERGLARAASHA